MYCGKKLNYIQILDTLLFDLLAIFYIFFKYSVISVTKEKKVDQGCYTGQGVPQSQENSGNLK